MCLTSYLIYRLSFKIFKDRKKDKSLFLLLNKMKKCCSEDCNNREMLLFKCKLCNQYYCTIHRLAEQHECPKIGYYKSNVYKNFKYSGKKTSETTFEQENSHKRKPQSITDIPYGQENRVELMKRTQNHIMKQSALFTFFSLGSNKLNILVANIFIISLASLNYTIRIALNPSTTFYSDFLLGLGIISVLLTAAYLGHEIIHSLTAQKFNVTVFYVLWKQGLIISTITILFPLLISPSYLIFKGVEHERTIEKEGKIAFSGALYLIFCLVGVSILASIIEQSPQINLALRIIPPFIFGFLIYHLMPFGPSDGTYIFYWNKKVLWGMAIFCILIFLGYTLILITH